MNEASAMNDDKFVELCMSGDAKRVEEAIINGANVNARKDKYGWTVLMWASWLGLSEIVEVLLEHGANVNAKGSRGYTALMSAAENNHTEIIKLLHSYGAK